jgi:prefoldin subunit 5
MGATAMNDRLVQLKHELERGQQQMTLLEQRRQELRDTILRISGAIQVLEELQASSQLHDQPALVSA